VEETMMAKGPSYRVAFRRRREGKTDYQQRRSLVLSGLPRMVIRGSLRNISVQLIKAEVGGDKVVASAHSNELAKRFGWQGGGGNLSAAYLTGLLCGYRATVTEVKEAVLDMGLHAPTNGSRVFAALKGVLDAGVMIPHDEGKLPDEKRVQGQHISEYAKQLSSRPESYQKRFAEQLSRGLHPEEIVEHFSQVKQKISSALQKVEVPEKREEKEKPSKEEIAKKKPRRRAAAEKPAKPRVKKQKKQEETEKTEEKK
jgi:large subunit ribosomal protein L18